MPVRLDTGLYHPHIYIDNANGFLSASEIKAPGMKGICA
jgi:hypothetical protein